MSDNSTELYTNKVTLYHDGECPLCNFEIKMMKKLDINNAIQWVDITTDKKALDAVGINYQQTMARVHVQDVNENMVTGVRGFMLVWKQLPYYRRVVPVLENVPLLPPILEGMYTIFAKYRLTLTGKKLLTEDTCTNNIRDK